MNFFRISQFDSKIFENLNKSSHRDNAVVVLLLEYIKNLEDMQIKKKFSSVTQESIPKTHPSLITVWLTETK